ncbi:MAG: methylmalonyl Co-A mutase-associated GTPase MeaB [Bacteroidales bacterium]|nr:methylmalonyl Co-A mutase-associated GTPase MeaB [Lentimicrobiaceae bacterium]MDD5694212.1 methylmalonyl Co-A mutase-associated GTPase MeaB [Bacteroidales bacterium]
MAHRNLKDKSALHVQKGIEQPPQVSDSAVSKFKKISKTKLELEDYVAGIRASNRVTLGKAITLVESALPEHQTLAREVIDQCLPYSGHSIRVGITGVPGAGKSTFIETLGKYLTGQGRKLAILAIDPSSQRSKGSILGDKTRMEQLSVDPNAFIRPSPSGGSLGGVARKTRESIILCEAAGYDTIFVETVGVGQSETAVHSMVDFFLLLMIPGAGDELQGIKRGIIEMADAIIINKADGDNLARANRAAAEYRNALHLLPPSSSGWTPRVELCSALNNSGIDSTWDLITEYVEFTRTGGFFETKRREQLRQTFYHTIRENLIDDFNNNRAVREQLNAIEDQLVNSGINVYDAAQQLINLYFRSVRR